MTITSLSIYSIEHDSARNSPLSCFHLHPERHTHFARPSFLSWNGLSLDDSSPNRVENKYMLVTSATFLRLYRGHGFEALFTLLSSQSNTKTRTQETFPQYSLVQRTSCVTKCALHHFNLESDVSSTDLWRNRILVKTSSFNRIWNILDSLLVSKDIPIKHRKLTFFKSH